MSFGSNVQVWEINRPVLAPVFAQSFYHFDFFITEMFNFGFGKQIKSLLSKSVLRFGQKCIYKKLWLFQDIFQKKLGGQKNVGHAPNLNFSIFSLFYVYKNGSFKHYFFFKIPDFKKIKTRVKWPTPT